ncbi:MAG: peptidylprolyl isomerase [Pseudomonadota bacterium]
MNTYTICLPVLSLLRHPRRSTAAILLCISALGWSNFSLAENARVLMQTNMGNVEMEVLEKLAPRTAANFLQLVDDEFYSGLIFHRVIANFMIQAGGFTEDLTRKPAPRTVPNESFNGLKNSRGSVAMARTDDPDSAGSQFYINVKDNPFLDADGAKAGYTVFARVISGMDTVEKIELTNTGRRGGMVAVPEENIVILSIQRIE